MGPACVMADSAKSSEGGIPSHLYERIKLLSVVLFLLLTLNYPALGGLRRIHPTSVGGRIYAVPTPDQ